MLIESEKEVPIVDDKLLKDGMNHNRLISCSVFQGLKNARLKGMIQPSVFDWLNNFNNPDAFGTLNILSEIIEHHCLLAAARERATQGNENQ